jgi:hypothetical protein
VLLFISVKPRFIDLVVEAGVTDTTRQDPVRVAYTDRTGAFLLLTSS